MKNNKICVICKKEYTEWGNNALPIADGQCCNKCNSGRVIPARLRRVLPHIAPYESKKNMFNKEYDFDESPTEKELKIIEDAIEKAKPQISITSAVDIIMKELQLPKDKEENVSRAVFNANHILKDRKLKAKGFIKTTRKILEKVLNENEGIVVLSESVFGNSLVGFKVRTIRGDKYFMRPGARTRYTAIPDLLDKYIKII